MDDDALPRHRVSPARLICLECQPDPDDFTDWVTFCDDPRCYTVALPNAGFPPHVCAHDPDHDFVKVRTAVHALEWGLLCRRAADGPRDMLQAPAPNDPPSLEHVDGEALACVDVAIGEPSMATEAHTDSTSADGPASLHNDSSPEKDTAGYAPLAVKPISCMVCDEEVFMGRCWYCLDCAGTYVTLLSQSQ